MGVGDVKAWLRSASADAVIRRALASALIVGPILIVINHGDAIVHGDFSNGRLLRILLTIVVPYWVSTVSSVQATRAARLAAATLTLREAEVHSRNHAVSLQLGRHE